MKLRIAFVLGSLAVASVTAGEFLQKFVEHHPLSHAGAPAQIQNPASPKPWTHREPGPVPDLREFAREKDGAVWLGSKLGAARFDPNARHPWDRWQYFAGKRWLVDDAVQNIVVEDVSSGRSVWIRTRAGLSHLRWRPMTLEEKASVFDARIEARHVRHGFVAGSALSRPGDLSTNSRIDHDNDGLWTAMYLGAQAYRYGATKDPEARARARRAFQAILRLEAITGRPGFYARSFKSRDEPPPGSGEWHPTADGLWLWKADTSSDESVGHYYAYALYYDLVADAQEREQIRAVVSRMTDHLIENDYSLIDLDGKPTRWGEWSEKYFRTEEGRYEAPLRSLELLSFLKTTHHITGNARYAAAYQDRVARGYADQMRQYRRWPGGGEINFSDDELAYLSYEPLLRYEKDARLRAIYLDGLRFSAGQVRPEHNPLWNYIGAASGAVVLDATLREESRRALERVPMDLVEWTMRNSHRIDVTFAPGLERHGRRCLTRVLAPDERAIHKWNANPYVPDGGGGGLGEDDGTFFLLPYWMGRYHGWLR